MISGIRVENSVLHSKNYLFSRNQQYTAKKLQLLSETAYFNRDSANSNAFCKLGSPEHARVCREFNAAKWHRGLPVNYSNKKTGSQ